MLLLVLYRTWISYGLRMNRPCVYKSCKQSQKGKGQNCRATFPLMSLLAQSSNIHSLPTHPCRGSSACFLFTLFLSASLQQEQEVGWEWPPSSPSLPWRKTMVTSHETMIDEQTSYCLTGSLLSIFIVGMYESCITEGMKTLQEDSDRDRWKQRKPGLSLKHRHWHDPGIWKCDLQLVVGP